jgi:ABC-type sugar transport system ATPase subunit
MHAIQTVPILSLRDVGKSYGAVVAVRQVDLDIAPGELVAICGNNGAGKSSLVKIISGAEDLSSGTLSIRGKPARFSSPHDALAHGVATLYQDLALAPGLSSSPSCASSTRSAWPQRRAATWRSCLCP